MPSPPGFHVERWKVVATKKTVGGFEAVWKVAMLLGGLGWLCLSATGTVHGAMCLIFIVHLPGRVCNDFKYIFWGFCALSFYFARGLLLLGAKGG